MTSKSQNQKEQLEARVMVVEDHPIVRHGIVELINGEEGLTVCGEAAEAGTVMNYLKEEVPDMLLMDLSLKGYDGLQLMKEIKSQFPDLPVLILSMHDENYYAERALRAGAKGYIMKKEATNKLLNAIKQVLNGKIYLSENMSSVILSKLASGGSASGASAIDRLSDRELEVLRYIGDGLKTSQIASELHLSGKTVEAHKAHIKEKLGLKSAQELAHFAFEWIRDNNI